MRDPLVAGQPGADAQIEVHAVLHGRGLGHALEEQPGPDAVRVLAGPRRPVLVLGQRGVQLVPRLVARSTGGSTYPSATFQDSATARGFAQSNVTWTALTSAIESL